MHGIVVVTSQELVCCYLASIFVLLIRQQIVRSLLETLQHVVDTHEDVQRVFTVISQLSIDSGSIALNDNTICSLLCHLIEHYAH